MQENVDTDNSLSGLKVLIVEDEAAIAMLLEDMLLDLDCDVAGTASRVTKAKELIAGTELDAAILDLNLAGESAYPLAEELARRGISFIFSTGYGELGIKKEFQNYPVLRKPFLQQDLKQCLLEVVALRKAP